MNNEVTIHPKLHRYGPITKSLDPVTTQPTELEIRIHSLDGHVTTFAQNDPVSVRMLLDQMQPGKIFGQPYLSMVGDGSLTIFPSTTVARVDVVMPDYPDWPFHFGILDARELTLQEFRERTSSAQEEAKSTTGPRRVYAHIDLRDGQPVYLALDLHRREEPRTKVDFSMLLQRFLWSPSLHARRLGGGALVINLAQILRLQFHPTPLHSPINAWFANPVTEENPAVV